MLPAMRAVLASVFVLLLSAGMARAQPAESRVALVLGNAAYKHADALRNPENDARAMAGALRQTGFDVILKVNATRREMTEAMREFASKVTPGGVALFYYAGHGVQVRGANYLLPVDASLADEDELKYEAIDVNDILGRLDEARVRLSLVILDACRDNPFPRKFRSASRGLAQVDAPRGTLIAYATAPGETAADGDGQNGLYTEELLKALTIPSLKIEEVFKRTIDGVAQRSGNKQTPWVSSSFRGEFFFIAPVAVVMPPSGAVPGGDAAPLSQQQVEHAAWGAIANSTSPAAFELFLKRFPDGTYADFARHRLEELNKQAQGAQPTPQAISEEQRKAAEQAEQQLALNEAQRRRVKAALGVKGFDTGSADGTFNLRARQMIANYQRSRNEPGTGFLSAPQYAALIKETQEALAKQEAERQRAAAVTPAAPTPAPAVQQAARAVAPVVPATPPAAQPAAAGVGQGTGRFDGSWSATISCGGASGARGYSLVLNGRTTNGTIVLTKGTPGQPDYLIMQGRIGGDGTAMLQANGIVGNPIYATNNAMSGTQYTYAVRARFEGSHGTGERLGARSCGVVFSKL